MDQWTHWLALAAGLGWASGMRLYACSFVLGMLDRLGYVSLPGSLDVLGQNAVLVGCGVMCIGEFVADKIPAFDSLWDAAHTFVRGPGAALLVGLAFNGQTDTSTQALLALFGGGLASLTHLGKAGARLAINHSPEPFSNIVASTVEDVGSMGILWLAWQHPWALFAALFGFLLLLAWLLPKVWRSLRRTFKFLRQPSETS